MGSERSSRGAPAPTVRPPTAVAGEGDVLQQVAAAIGAGEPGSQLLTLLAERIGAAIELEEVRVLRHADDEHDVLMGAWTHLDTAPELGTTERIAPDSAAAETRVTGRPASRRRRAGDAPSDGVLVDVELAVPLFVDGELWGAVVGAGHLSVRRATMALERLTALSDVAAITVAYAVTRERAATLATSDPLTGLPHKQAFLARLGDELARARRTGQPLAVIMIDVDELRDLNETHGEASGDRALAEVAGILRDHARRHEMVGRLDGDAFGWIVADAEDAPLAAERVRSAIETETARSGRPITVSLGICDAALADDPEELLERAAEAVYWAKMNGRNAAFEAGENDVRPAGDRRTAAGRATARARDVIGALARTIDAMDPATGRHSLRVGDLAALVGAELGWSDGLLQAIREAGRLHDVGKICIPESILVKPGRLTDEEFEQVKAHAAFGAQMVCNVLSPAQTAWIRGHHERWDGGGYPDGLAGEEVPQGARILAIVDAWDMMNSEHSYAPALSPERALAELLDGAGTQFWPDGVAALQRVVTGSVPDAPHIARVGG
jgi:diguanylate cyclase (GGDEF)-like protein